MSLRLRAIRKRFGATLALDGVDLDVAAGEVHAIIGENGAGKSTLMKVVAGAVAPDEGSIELAGAPFAPGNPIDGRDAGVAMIYQELTLAPHCSVIENVRLGRERSIDRPTALDAMKSLGISAHADAPLKRLGTGQRQLVEIARAIAADARVVVLDEPTSSLGAVEAALVFDAMRRLREQGRAVVFISHHLDEVRRIADRFTVLRDGRSVASGRVADVTNDELVRFMIGRPIEQVFAKHARTPGDVVLEVSDVRSAALARGASLTLRRGEIVGIAGLVGSGRTEFLRAIFGLDAVRRGRIQVGAWIGGGTLPVDRLEQGVGMLSEDRATEGLAQKLSVATNLLLSSLRGGFARDATLERASARWIDQLRIKARASAPVRELSGGNQQKVALARLLARDVDVFLLDEPTRGIDVGSKVEIYALLERLAASGKSIILVSSDASELLGLCDRIAVMHRGGLGAARDASQWTEESIVAASSVGASVAHDESRGAA